jgi:ppGpp synthetase/RelA/SpoT-type nucleotidyltranferase
MNQTEQGRISPDEHRKQIEAYRKESEFYEIYADVLKRVLENARAVAIPHALIQSREKTVSSFAEKCARRFHRYPDAVNQMTDLCGARVIVQTLEQVKAVRQFIEANFTILERDDKGLQLSEDKFGYRDMHYIIRLIPERCTALGITAKEREAIGLRPAEVQVRTWLQHAWADTLHDRIYKSALTLSPDVRRTGALLAALMEEGDRTYNVIANELDGMAANYTAFALRRQVEKEIDVQGLILRNEPDERKKPGLALTLARLLRACGRYGEVVKTLTPYRDLQDANRCEMLQYLGYALCKAHRASPNSRNFQRGKRFLEESLTLCDRSDPPFVPDLRKEESLHARALSWLGWVEEQIPGNEHKAREYRRRAHEHEPSNPYYLADMLGFEMKFTHQADLPATLLTVIREAITACRSQAVAGIELPYAYFTAGRLNLLLDQPLDALGYYARGVQHYLASAYCFPDDVVEDEIAWLKRLHFGKEPPDKCRWVRALIDLTLDIKKRGAGEVASRQIGNKVLIVVGGAASMNKDNQKRVRPLIETALKGFSVEQPGRKGSSGKEEQREKKVGKKVICGGTIVGVPGLVGEISSELAARKEKRFTLIGYIPKRLPHDGRKDDRYDRPVICGQDKFSPDQILQSWKDILNDKVNPKDVLLLGFGGGTLSALEYRLALAFGASVAVVAKVGGAGDKLLQDGLWSALPNLLPLPFDSMSVRAFVTQSAHSFSEGVLEEMAKAFHDQFVAGSAGRLPDNMKPWADLKDTYRRANTEQAGYAVQILRACDFEVREVSSPSILEDVTNDEIERMAEMEHGRWIVERLRDGWRLGPRDNAKKLHDCLVPWSELPDHIKRYDRDAVRNFPSILEKAGLEVYRKNVKK